ncbi:MAG: hypothetical protein U9O20_03275 [Patescibacteria group bacterium]|nr:hypothetical protein [Patescibacteria group bacterium]
MIQKLKKKQEKRRRKKSAWKLCVFWTVLFVFSCLFICHGAFAAHTSTEKNLGLVLSNIVVEKGTESPVSTKIYPGYTMSFDVAIVSGFADEQEPVMFEYSVIDDNDEMIYSIGEQRKIGKENVFTKRMTLPSDIEPGTYKLRIKSVIDEQSMTQEQFFEIEQSPVVTIKESGKYVLVTLVTENSWFFGGMIVSFLIIFFFVGVFVVHKKNQVRSHTR